MWTEPPAALGEFQRKPADVGSTSKQTSSGSAQVFWFRNGIPQFRSHTEIFQNHTLLSLPLPFLFPAALGWSRELEAQQYTGNINEVRNLPLLPITQYQPAPSSVFSP